MYDCRGPFEGKHIYFNGQQRGEGGFANADATVILTVCISAKLLTERGGGV